MGLFDRLKSARAQELADVPAGGAAVLKVPGSVPRREAAGAPQIPPNTPPVAHASVRLFAELFGDPTVQATRWFIVAVVLGLVALVEGAALYQLIPLKRAVPYLMEPRADGSVTRPREAADFKPTDAMIKWSLGSWTERQMLIDPFRTRENLRQNTVFLRGKAVTQQRELIAADSPFERMLATPSLTRSAQVTGMDTSQPGIAFVFITTTERSANSEPLTQKWRFTFHYATVAPDGDEQELMQNPLGLQLLHIERAQDRS